MNPPNSSHPTSLEAQSDKSEEPPPVDNAFVKQGCEQFSNTPFDRMNKIINEPMTDRQKEDLINHLTDENIKFRSKNESLRKQIEQLTAGLRSAITELERVNVVKDGMPTVSHNLLYNLRKLTP